MMLYVHVPFCRHKCVYCDFMSGTNIGLRRQYIDRLREEFSEVAGGFTPRTIYFGGGTPSMLTPGEIAEMYAIVGAPAVEEWTIECNPEDMTPEWLHDVRQLGVSRLSIGVQSLHDSELRWMERRHSAADAVRAVREARKAGFSNVSVDVMFGLPGQSVESLKSTLEGVLSLDVEHLSAYSLMFEEGSKITMKNVEPIDEDVAAEMYRMVCSMMASAGYEHYEISNWARPGFRALHNYGYWTGEPYIGLGPAAHSFDGHAIRSANVPNTVKWLRGDKPEVETLSNESRFNERVMLGLRTAEGIDLNALSRDFPDDWIARLQKELAPYSSLLTFSRSHDRVTLFPAGVYVSDLIMQSCMRV